VVPRPRVVVGIRAVVTEVEKRAVEDAATQCRGAANVSLIEEPMAAAIGSRLPIQDAAGSMIVGTSAAGTTEVAIISLGGIVASRVCGLQGMS